MFFLKKKNLPQKNFFFTFFLCNFSVRTLQCFQIFFFFAHKNLKKPPSKVAHQARTFFPTAQPTANSPKSIFHNMKMSHQASVLSSVVRCKLGFSKIENTIIDDPYVQKFDFFSNWFIFKKFFDGNKIILLNVFFSFVDFSSLLIFPLHQLKPNS